MTLAEPAAPRQPGPLDAYQALLRAGRIAPDAAQARAARRLQDLADALAGYRPARAGGWRGLLGLGRRSEPPRGVYLHGGVGRGKSMLMDLFFRTAPVEAKRRVHFHEFMLEIHDRLHQWRQSPEARRAGSGDDPVPPLARRVADEATLLCFDEFHVVDIADAMILGRLFTALLDLGVVVVATSNWAPDDLYAGGLQRDRFLPFIALLKERLDAVELDGGVDYRLRRLQGIKVYHWPLGPPADRALEAAFAELTEGAASAPETVPLKGRVLDVPRAARGVAWMEFDELCGRPHGAADYLALARRYDTVILSGVPRLGEDQRNEAKRFVTLIDALYEHRTKLILSAEAPPERLYAGDTHAAEFARTVSRLAEMQSADYLGGRHLAGPGAGPEASSGAVSALADAAEPLPA